MSVDMSKHFSTSALIRFTLPTIAMMIFTSCYTIVDGFFVSNYAGKTALAAVNLIFPAGMILASVGMMIGTGGSALVAKTLGEGDRPRARRHFSLLIIFAFVVGSVLSLGGWFFMEPTATMLGATPGSQMHHDAALYGRMMMISLPFFILQYAFQSFFVTAGKPKYGFFIGGGNVDSMVSHYSVAKIPRAEDEYSPGGKAGARPDRSATVYTKLAKQAYPDLPVILGGLEASLRRFAHYDYWLDTVLPSIAEDSGADLISFGMGEHQTVEIARRLAAGEPVETITDVNGTCYLTDFDHLPQRYVECAGFKKVASDKTAYAKACRIQMDNQDVVSGQIIVQKQSEKYLVQNIPAKPLVRGELDKVYALPYTRRYHPIYESMGGVPAIREVQFSIIQNRGCFGGCNFCAIQLHQGRRVTSRSADSIVEEAERMTHEPDFKGYIHDVGGPTANFRFPSCREQMLRGMCTGGKHCLAPTTCSHMIVDHSDYLKILRRVRELPGVKKVFIRSGIRFDYLMADPDDTFFKELVEYHVSGQLKVAPEHCAPNTLAYMGKPPIETFNKFKDKFYELSKKAGKKQYLVPYLMSSHPGSTLSDAVYLAEYLYKNHMRPEQVQDFYPTPGTVSTCMFYTGLDPYTLKPVFVEKTAEGKALQRALLQYYEPRNAEKVIKALKMTHREDLIPLLVPAEGRRAVQRSARRAEPAEVTIHNDGTYTVRPNKGRGGRDQSRGTAPARTAGGRQPSPGARFAPNGTAPRKPKNDQQKENTAWKTSKKKK